MELEKLESISFNICDKIIAIEKFLEEDKINKEWIKDTLKEIDTLADNVYEIYEETCGLEEEKNLWKKTTNIWKKKMKL